MDTAFKKRLREATPEQRVQIMMNERPEEIWGGKHRDFREMCDLVVKKPVLHVRSKGRGSRLRSLMSNREYTAPTQF